MALSKAMIIGNLGRDPEMRYTPSGRAVTAVHRRGQPEHKNQQTGEWIEGTDWFRVGVWGDRAERTAENLRKGSGCSSRAASRRASTKAKDGQKRTSLEITADTVLGLDARGRDEEGSFAGAPAGGLGRAGGRVPRAGAPAGRRTPRRLDDTDIDDLPF